MTDPTPDRELSPWRRAVWWTAPHLIRATARVAWRLEVDDGHGFPPPPFVIASNHHSFLDPPLVGAAWGRHLRFVTLVDLFGRHRWLDAVLEVFEAIPVRRGAVPLGAVRTALDHLRAGGVVAVFPEGTRFSEFDPSRTRPGAAWLAARVGVPLVPVAVAGTERVLGVDNRLHRGRVHLEIGPPLHPSGAGREAVEELHRRWGEWVGSALGPTTGRAGHLRSSR